MTNSESGSPVEDDKTDRRAILAVGTQFWINGMVYAAVVPRLPDIRDRLSIGVATLGTILTIAALGGLFGSAVSGSIIERFGTKRCIQVGTVATMLVLPLVGVVNSPAALVVVIGSLAMFDVVIDIGMNLQGSWLSAARTTPIMNRLHGLWSLGTVIGGIIAVRAAGSGISLSTHLLAISVVLALTLLVSGRFLLSTDRAATAAGEPGTASADGPVEAETKSSSTVRQVNGLPRAASIRWMLVILGAAAVTMELTTSDWAAFRLADDLGAAPGRVGLGFVAFTSGMVTGRFAGDTIQAAIGDRALIKTASIVAATGLAMATALPFQWITDSTNVAIVVSVVGFYVAALGVSVIFPQLYDVAAQAPGRAGAGLAALTAGTRIAGVASPIIVGSLAATSLSVGTAMAVITIPTCLLTYLVRPPSSRPSS